MTELAKLAAAAAVVGTLVGFGVAFLLVALGAGEAAPIVAGSSSGLLASTIAIGATDAA